MTACQIGTAIFAFINNAAISALAADVITNLLFLQVLPYRLYFLRKKPPALLFASGSTKYAALLSIRVSYRL